jgi:hypothetical protein
LLWVVILTKMNLRSHVQFCSKDCLTESIFFIACSLNTTSETKVSDFEIEFSIKK